MALVTPLLLINMIFIIPVLFPIQYFALYGNFKLKLMNISYTIYQHYFIVLHH